MGLRRKLIDRTPSQLPLIRLTRWVEQCWRWVYRKFWQPLLIWESRVGRRWFHRPDVGGWHLWTATMVSQDGNRVWKCNCGAERLAEWPYGRPKLDEGESSGWPSDVYDTVRDHFDEEEMWA